MIPLSAPDNPDARQVARAMALLWTQTGRARILGVLQAAGWHMASGAPFNLETVREGIGVLREHGWMRPWGDRSGPPLAMTDDARTFMYRDIIEAFPREHLKKALCKAHGVGSEALDGQGEWPFYEIESSIAVLRLELIGGASDQEINRHRDRIDAITEWELVWREACLDAFAPDLFMRTAAREFREAALATVLQEATTDFSIERLDMITWAVEACAEDPFEFSAGVCHQVATILLFQGRPREAMRLLSMTDIPDLLLDLEDENEDGYLNLRDGFKGAIYAAAMAQAGHWEEAQQKFESALEAMRKYHGRRVRVMDPALAWLYVLSLLAQNTPNHLKTARKFALAESRTLKPLHIGDWYLWVRAVDIRLGRAKVDPVTFHRGYEYRDSLVDHLWRIVARVWLGRQTFDGVDAPDTAPAFKLLQDRLIALDFTWLAELARTCDEVYHGAAPPPGFFARSQEDHWRTVLGGLEAVSVDERAPSPEPSVRLVWSITVDSHGRLEAITPMKQKRGNQGGFQPKKMPLSRLVRTTGLEPEDARVARAVRSERHTSTGFRMDLAAAAVALIGHPRVIMGEDSSLLVEVVRGSSTVDVVRMDAGFHLAMVPAPHASPPKPDREYDWQIPKEIQSELEAQQFLRVEQESARRIRIITFTPAQRHVAQLLNRSFLVPHDHEKELQVTLRALSKHFHILSDHTRSAQQVEPELRLRAELSPVGNGLLLRLVAAPLGPEGPRLTPGRGRSRLMANVGKQPLGTERDLAAERRQVDRVIDAIEFLSPPAADDSVPEWMVEDPELALTLLEVLPSLEAVSGLDWPRGRAVRVLPVGLTKVRARISTRQNWFQLDGEIKVSEGLVLTFAALLEAGLGKSRFIPMGDGVYAALSQELHERAVEMALIAEARGDAAAVPHAAVAWLQELLEGTDSQWDEAFETRVTRLREAREWAPAVPATLLTTLRPYQEEGFVWAMRLADTGFGACLADDMGLGKTIQALGVMLSRAADGPALVVAPTSVCGNWLAEMRRFSPSLKPIDFTTSDRKKRVEDAGPGDVIVLSYTMMLQEKHLLGTREWATLVADEAQAVKNPAAKRSLALFSLKAGFRMALSGTPIENRLSELWSIMRFCNPGLLSTRRTFNRRFAIPIEDDQDREAQRRLKRLIAPFMLRRTKAEVLHDLPPRTELVLTISADAAEAAHYEALRRVAVAEAERVAAGEGTAGGSFHILSLLMKLRRAACDPRLVTPDFPGRGAKVHAFAELAAELVANGHRALVFSQFVDFLKLLAEPLKEAGIRYEYLDGSTPSAERTRRVAAFQDGSAELFLISLKAGGFGLNLTAADYVVITDPWWNPAAEDQAMGRAHRIGQVRPVTAYRLVREATLEGRIIELHHQKRALAEGILSESGGSARIPDPAELIALMKEQ